MRHLGQKWLPQEGILAIFHVVPSHNWVQERDVRRVLLNLVQNLVDAPLASIFMIISMVNPNILEISCSETLK
jgi:hypothetical protein